MNIVAVLTADYESTFWGTPSRLRDSLVDDAVIHHTLRRFADITGVDQHLMIVQPRDAEKAKADIEACDLTNTIKLSQSDDGVRPRRELLRAARRWNQTSWRGGLMNATWFDEYVEPRLCARLCDELNADALYLLDAHHAAHDPVQCSQMTAHHRENPQDTPYVFTAAPPGLAGLLLSRSAIAELVEKNFPVGILLTYRPEFPALDPITDDTCLHIDRDIQTAAMRFVPDTTQSFERLQAAFAECGANATTQELCRWSARENHDFAGALPVEVELELTTRTALPDSLLRPKVEKQNSRECVNLDAIAAIARELAQSDDRLLVLSGFGDPLLHPRFAETLQLIRDNGQRNIAIETNLLDVPQNSLTALFEQQVTALLIRIDAHSAEAYQQIHNANRFAEVVATIQSLEKKRRDESRALPLLVPLFTRCCANIHELDAFYDYWVQAVGSALIRSASDYCGQLPMDDILHPAPPTRAPCRQLPRRLTLLANGRVAQCDQDVAGTQPLGNWYEQSLTEIWDAQPRKELLQLHANHDWHQNPLCTNCREWIRP